MRCSVLKLKNLVHSLQSFSFNKTSNDYSIQEQVDGFHLGNEGLATYKLRSKELERYVLPSRSIEINNEERHPMPHPHVLLEVSHSLDESLESVNSL